MTRTIFDTTNEEEFIQWSMCVPPAGTHSTRLGSLLDDESGNYPENRMLTVDKWITNNIHWLINHIEVKCVYTERAMEDISFTILGYDWTAFNIDPYYSILRQVISEKERIKGAKN